MKMRKIVARNNTLILDVRLRESYESGHIEGAYSLPVNCSDREYKQAISKLPKNEKIVLYCRSAKCKYAEQVALRMKADGFENLAIFKEGWVEWKKFKE